MVAYKFKGNIYAYEKGYCWKIDKKGEISNPMWHCDDIHDSVRHFIVVTSKAWKDNAERITLDKDLKDALKSSREKAENIIHHL